MEMEALLNDTNLETLQQSLVVETAQNYIFWLLFLVGSAKHIDLTTSSDWRLPLDDLIKSQEAVPENEDAGEREDDEDDDNDDQTDDEDDDAESEEGSDDDVDAYSYEESDDDDDDEDDDSDEDEEDEDDDDDEGEDDDEVDQDLPPKQKK